MARRDVPCRIICGSSLDLVVADGARVEPDAAGIEMEIEAVSRIVVRCGAAGVGEQNAPCRDEGRVDVTAVIEGALVSVDVIDPASEAVLVGTDGVASSTFTLDTSVASRLGGTGLRIEMPRVPKTLLADFRRASRRLGSVVDDGVSRGEEFSSASSPGR